jgi:hypothetical protein
VNACTAADRSGDGRIHGNSGPFFSRLRRSHKCPEVAQAICRRRWLGVTPSRLRNVAVMCACDVKPEANATLLSKRPRSSVSWPTTHRPLHCRSKPAARCRRRQQERSRMGWRAAILRPSHSKSTDMARHASSASVTMKSRRRRALSTPTRTILPKVLVLLRWRHSSRKACNRPESGWR